MKIPTKCVLGPPLAVTAPAAPTVLSQRYEHDPHASVVAVTVAAKAVCELPVFGIEQSSIESEDRNSRANRRGANHRRCLPFGNRFQLVDEDAEIRHVSKNALA